MIQDTRYILQDTGYMIQDTGYKIHTTGYGIHDTGYHDTGYKVCTALNSSCWCSCDRIQDTGYRTQDKRYQIQGLHGLELLLLVLLGQATIYQIYDTGYKVCTALNSSCWTCSGHGDGQDTGYKVQDAGYKIHDTGYKIQDAGYKIQEMLLIHFLN